MPIEEKKPEENASSDVAPATPDHASPNAATAPESVSVAPEIPTVPDHADLPEQASLPDQATPPAHVAPPEQARATTPNDAPRPRRRGFAAMDRERVKQIASKGGRAAHAAGTAHQFSSDEARIAGKKGGEAPHVRRGGVRRRPPADGSSAASHQGQGERHGQGERR